MADLLSSIISGANVIGQTSVAIQAASAYNQDPRKMSWNTINAIAQQNPELGAQLSQIKREYEAQKATKKANRQALKLAKLNQAAPAPAKDNSTMYILGGFALAAILIATSGKKRR